MKILTLALIFTVFVIQTNGQSNEDLASANNNGLARHNTLRARHGVPNLVLDATVASSAQSWANRLASTNTLQHSDDHTFGENLYSFCSFPSAPDVSTSSIMASNAWYNEISSYDFNNPGFSLSAGHFTQLVWRSSTNVGFGVALSKITNCIFVVARYLPPGNFEGEFPANVPRLV